MTTFHVERRLRSESKPKHLRRKGLLPMALVERSHETMLIQAPVDRLREAISHTDGLGRLDVQVEGESATRKAIVKHIEQDPLQHQLIHVTLQEVTDEDMVKVDVPVTGVGTPRVMEFESLMLLTPIDHVKLRGRMADLPDHIEVDLTNMEAGSHISVGDVELPEGVELMSSPDSVLFNLRNAFSVTAPEPGPVEEPSPEEEIQISQETQE